VSIAAKRTSNKGKLRAGERLSRKGGGSRRLFLNILKRQEEAVKLRHRSNRMKTILLSEKYDGRKQPAAKINRPKPRQAKEEKGSQKSGRPKRSPWQWETQRVAPRGRAVRKEGAGQIGGYLIERCVEASLSMSNHLEPQQRHEQHDTTPHAQRLPKLH